MHSEILGLHSCDERLVLVLCYLEFVRVRAIQVIPFKF